MKTLVASIAVVLAFAAGLSVALAGNPPTNPGKSGEHKPTTTGASGASGHSGTTTTLPNQAKGYGYYCQNQSKQHSSGQKSAFAQCVLAMAKLANGQTKSPRAACTALSKKHDPPHTGSPYSRCVAGGAKLLKDQHP